MSTELPLPQITTVSGKEVLSWSCACGQQLGEFSALRSFELHGDIVCGKCAQEKSPEYQEWVREQGAMDKLKWR